MRKEKWFGNQKANYSNKVYIFNTQSRRVLCIFTRFRELKLSNSNMQMGCKLIFLTRNDPAVLRITGLTFVKLKYTNGPHIIICANKVHMPKWSNFLWAILPPAGLICLVQCTVIVKQYSLGIFHISRCFGFLAPSSPVILLYYKDIKTKTLPPYSQRPRHHIWTALYKA